ncbi:MAG: hypothetical protein LBU00_03120 [Treponema sp.]|jgi:hypothetical protein|nr:hypothetical protein [Treponema sp.]
MYPKLLLTYSVLNKGYKNGQVRFLRGQQDADSATPSAGTVENPRDTGIPMLPTVADPKIFSFAYRGDVRFLLCKVNTPVPGTPSVEGLWSLLLAPTPPYGVWGPLARDIVLKDSSGNAVLANPYGVAQNGDTLYIAEYDSQKVYALGVNELNGLADGASYTLTKPVLDLGPGTTANLPANAKAQAIITLTDANKKVWVFVLYIVANASGSTHQNGVLVRLSANSSGNLSYDTTANNKVNVGRNPQEIIPVTETNGNITLLIPAIGGMQQTGSSNGTNSNITFVPAFGAWSYGLSNTAPVLLTGDPMPSSGEPTVYDIRAIAAPSRADSNGVVYILTGTMGEYYTMNWALYKTTVGTLLSIQGTPTLSTSGLTAVDSDTGSMTIFLDILYENGETSAQDRLWFFRTTPLLVCPAAAYPASPSPTPPTQAYRFFDYGESEGNIGGYNVDWADLSIETVRQIAAGTSLKRSVRALKVKAASDEEEEK